MRIPLINLQAQYQAIQKDIARAIDEVCQSQRFILGPKGQQLEEQIAALARARYAVAVSSGTDALLVSLMAAGIGPGDEVLTTPLTFFATAECVSRLGAKPVFVDIDPATYNLDTTRAADEIRRRRAEGKPVKAVIPVHLFGHCAAMEPLLELAKSDGLAVVEDAAQALGASSKGRPAGSMGLAGCFSFFPTKNLGGFGDGGMVVTSDDRMAERLQLLRNHGSQPKYVHHVIGGNFRLDELQAAVLLVKLRHLAKWNAARQEHAAAYERLFRQHGLLEHLTPPVMQPGEVCIYHQYVIRTAQRDALRDVLAERGVETEIYYPLPLHLQACYRDLGYPVGAFPAAERAAQEVLALPVFPELTAAQQSYVVETMAAFFRS